jgi:carbon-monoxide dehydrogenase large subunit
MTHSSSIAAAGRSVGASATRVEDARLLTGQGRYAGDIRVEGMLHAAFVRSPVPHGRVVAVDLAAARAAPGVELVLGGAELAAAIGNLQPAGAVPPSFPPLAVDHMRHNGDPLVLVVAASRYLAEDAAALVQVDYEPLPAVATIEHARDAARPPLFEDLGSNVVYGECRRYGDVAGAFARADRVVRRRFDGQRVCPSPLETCGGVASFDAASGLLTYEVNTQSTHWLRSSLAGALGHPAEQIRVLAPDVGGAFGQKSASTFREDAAVCFAALQLARPVKWIEDRVENLAASSQARSDLLELAAAVLADGTVLALDVRIVHDQGAYPLVPARPARFGSAMRTMLPGPYRIDNVGWELQVVATTKATYGAYRGPWAPEVLAREVLFDEVARELGLDAVELRRRNLIRPDEQPRPLATGPTLTGVTTLESLERAVERVDYGRFRERQARLRSEGRLLGIGFSAFVEAAPGPPDFYTSSGWPAMSEPATASLGGDGVLTISTPQSPAGQGHRTTLAQVAAAEFGVRVEDVRIVLADTASTPANLLGTAGSRAGTMASGAVVHASRALRLRVLELASELLEIAPGDLEVVAGEVRPRGVPARAVPLAEIAASAPEPLSAGAVYEHPDEGGGWSGGTHVCVAEVDPLTGSVTLLRYVVVEDCGAVINPAIVDGQIRGGVAQGIGVALLEDAHYDSEGTFLAGTFVDYLLPTAMEIPPIEIVHLESRPAHEVDFRGIGEGGTVAAPPAVVNAVADALGGVAFSELPLTPERVLAALDAR